jgi:hypothetical protein
MNDEIDFLRANFEPGSCIPDEEQMVREAMNSPYPATAMMQLHHEDKLAWSVLVKWFRYWRGAEANLQDAADKERDQRRAA